ncbi:hypothetical protein BGZ60DRAFT_569849 [Tricladium varicosporioides]|nr:hypothetical protein BGZ60DRAFT_569849 [Hymenoscyphus varicosporioides]
MTNILGGMSDSSSYMMDDMYTNKDIHSDIKTVISCPQIRQRESSTSSIISNSLSLSTTKTTPPLLESPLEDHFAATAVDFFAAVAQDGELCAYAAIPNVAFPPNKEKNYARQVGLSATAPTFVTSSSSCFTTYYSGEQAYAETTSLSASTSAFILTESSQIQPKPYRKSSTVILHLTAAAPFFLSTIPLRTKADEQTTTSHPPLVAPVFSPDQQIVRSARPESSNAYPSNNHGLSTTRPKFHDCSTLAPQPFTSTSFSVAHPPLSTLDIKPFHHLSGRPQPRVLIGDREVPSKGYPRGNTQQNIKAERGQFTQWIDERARVVTTYNPQTGENAMDREKESVATNFGEEVESGRGRGRGEERWIDTRALRREQLYNLLRWRSLLLGPTRRSGSIQQPSLEELQCLELGEERVSLIGVQEDFLPDSMFQREHHGLQLNRRDVGRGPWWIGYRLEGMWGKRKGLGDMVVKGLWCKTKDEEKSPYRIKHELWGVGEDEIWLGKDYLGMKENGKGVVRDGVENGFGHGSASLGVKGGDTVIKIGVDGP